ncbi:MAG: dTMP kinase [bacterium]|nr:dTMP kinase [bacterium]
MASATFIVLEGGEGAGKTTIAHVLAEQFPDLLVTRAWGTSLGAKLRVELISEENKDLSPQTQFALALAAHADEAEKIVAPALARGMSVVSDRFDASTFAYQAYAQQATTLEFFFTAREELLSSKPDLYIFLDVTPEIGLSRIKKAGKSTDHIERKGVEFHGRVREGYLEFFKHVPHKVVDASRPLEEVQAEVFEEIKKHLNG